MDSVHQIITKQIVDTLHTLNENIVNLGDYLTTTGLVGDAEQNTVQGINRDELQKEASDQVNQRNLMNDLTRTQEGEVNQKDNDAAETLQAMDKDDH